MAILKIARMGHPVLRRVADPVDDPRAPAIHRLIADMVDTMADAPGIGLAAPQVHVPKRVVIFHIPESRARNQSNSDGEDGDGDAPPGAVPMTVLINPVIEPLTDEKALGVEGCLSLPGMLGMVPRFTRIRYRAVGPDGKPIDREASGYHARVVQHECDHLDGVLYPLRMDDLSTFGYADEMGRDELPLGDRLRRRERQDDV
ncbi:MAG TPA: peptide deformylase [Rhodospirillales bacterium]